MNSDSLNQFIDKLIEEKGYSNLESDIKEQMKSDLIDNLYDSINSTLISKLPEDKLDELSNIVDQNDIEKVVSFVKDNVPNSEQIITDELIKFRNIYLGLSL